MVSAVWLLIPAALTALWIVRLPLPFARKAVALVAVAHLTGVFALTFFPFPVDSSWPLSGFPQYVHPNLVPFATIGAALQDGPRSQDFRALLGNALLLLPLGVYLPMLSARYRRWWIVLLAAIALSTAIELGQLLVSVVALHIPYRSTDIDDVLVNSAGAMAGYVLYLAARPLAARRRELRAR